MSPRPRRSTPRILVAWAAASCFCSTAHAQTDAAGAAESASSAADVAIDCPDPDDPACRELARRKAERNRAGRGEQATPMMSAAAPLPTQGTPPPPPRIERGALSVRRLEYSVGADFALAPQWVLSGLAGGSQGRQNRQQSEFAPDAAPGGLPTVSDTTVRSRSLSAAVTLSYFPQPSVFIDASVSALRSHFDVERLVNDAALFSGSTSGRGWGASLTAGTVLRGAGWAVVPQAGLDYVDSRVEPLQTSFVFVNAPNPPVAGFRVGEQGLKTLSSLLGVQVQWPRSASFGTVTPYLRASWRERLAIRTNLVEATANGADTRLLDPEAQLAPRAVALGGGALIQFTHGISVFAELGLARGSNQLRETRLALGLKFER